MSIAAFILLISLMLLVFMGLAYIICLSLKVGRIYNENNKLRLIIESHSKRHSGFDDTIKALWFAINNGKNSTVIEPNYLNFYYEGYFDPTIKYVSNNRMSSIKFPTHVEPDDCTIMKDTETEAIIKIKNDWYKLDKNGERIFNIPEPAEFAEEKAE